MASIARFEKVSLDQFVNDWTDTFGTDFEGQAREVYESISLPARATKGSAGYDFKSPLAFSLAPGETIKVPTGIRAWMEEGWVLLLFPRSGLGFKYRLQLNNTVGVVDSDYYGAKNEGHIFARITNDSNEQKTVSVQPGEGFIQGVFVPFGTAEEESVESVRTGGFGSTSIRV